MQWGDGDDTSPGSYGISGLGISILSMPVRVEVSLTGAPWEFRARLVEAGADYCVLALISPCAPALRRDATALLHVGTLGSAELTFTATVTDVVARPSGLTLRCSVERVSGERDIAGALSGIWTARSA
jgi:hypothetical protein